MPSPVIKMLLLMVVLISGPKVIEQSSGVLPIITAEGKMKSLGSDSRN